MKSNTLPGHADRFDRVVGPGRGQGPAKTNAPARVDEPLVNRILELSSAHLSEADAAQLTDHARPDDIRFDQWPRVIAHEYGWVLPVASLTDLADNGAGDLADVAPTLAACLDYARSLGCRWLYLDGDAPVVDALATHEW